MTAHTFRPVDALLFDMDGTLIDSTPLVEAIWRDWAKKHQLDEETVLKMCHGRQSRTTMQALAPHINVAHEVVQMLKQELSAVGGFGPIAGVHDFLRPLKDTEHAIVTSAQRELAQKRLEVCHIPVPSVFVANEDTPRSKPAPDGFLLAAKALGVEPARCLVFEDSLAGLEAGRAAGMQTLQIGAAKPPKDPASPIRVEDYRQLRLVRANEGLVVTALQLAAP